MIEAAGRPPRWIVIVTRGDSAALYHLAAMTASATALGIEVFLVWLGEALETLVRGGLDDPASSGASASDLLSAARETGRLRHLACSAAAVSASGGPDAVRGIVDDVVGWPTVVNLMRDSEKTLVW